MPQRALRPVNNRRDTRASSSRRGYTRQWRKIRAEVLSRHGIPQDQWHRYDVDHRPAYNPGIEPDHRKYNLVPMLRADHSRKTAAVDGSFGRGQPDRPHIKPAKPVSRIVNQSGDVRVS